MTTRTLHVHLLPELVPPHQLAGKTVVVIDILRATTTVTYALAAGMTRVMPCLEISEARELARNGRAAGEAILLGGERGGLPIAGFDLGNSPGEYTAERVTGRSLLFTTTNGTRALMRCVGAERVLLGSFASWSAVWREIQDIEAVEVLCAGTEGEVSWEDTLYAGSLVSAWAAHGGTDDRLSLNDAARLARAAWSSAVGTISQTERLATALRAGKGGQNLLAIGREADIDQVAQSDALAVVPELSLADWWIRPAGG